LDPTRPAIVAEVALNLAGAGILCRLAFERFVRKRRAPSSLSEWDLPAVDFLLFLALALGTGFAAQVLLSLAIRRFPLDADTRLVFGGAAMDAGVLAGAASFLLIVRRWRLALRGNSGRILSGGAATFLVALPIVNAVSAVWQGLLDACGVPFLKQDMVDVLLNTHSPLTRSVLILLAVAVAPLTEEVIFRAGIFRFLQTYLPRLAAKRAEESPEGRRWFGPRMARALALLLPAALFGAAHGSLSFFAPLLVLGIVFSLAYERTGVIGTTVVAHGLFNLNTIALVFAGLTS
jgi:membrane protease YdiL (CAAX protease family)